MKKIERVAIEERTMSESEGRGVLIAPARVIRHPVDEATLTWTAQAIRNYRSWKASAA